MGTLVAIEATHADASRLATALDSAFDAVGVLERTLHPEREHSDLVAIRNSTHGTPVPVEPTTVQVLRLAHEIWKKSQGVFDPCLPDASGSMRDVIIDDTHVTALRDVHLDLGGIAKGFAVDVAIETLIAHGCEAGVVNAGGDMRAFGRVCEVVVKCGELRLQRSLTNSAIAVSDAHATMLPVEHRGYYRRDVSAELVAQGAIVYANRAAIADALTKCLLLSNRDASAAILREFDARGEVW